jgi:hypothetical protein
MSGYRKSDLLPDEIRNQCRYDQRCMFGPQERQLIGELDD